MDINTKNTCPICGRGNLEKKIGYSYEYKGQVLNLPSYTTYVCSACEQEMELGIDNVDLDEEIMNFMRQVDGLLSPKQICKIRKSLGLTQTALSEILGVGVKTFARYESGSVTQSRIMDNFLRVMDKYPVILSALDHTPSSYFAYSQPKSFKCTNYHRPSVEQTSQYGLAKTGTCDRT